MHHIIIEEFAFKQSDPPRAQPREVRASVYCDLAVLAERQRGRSEPFEGIRLVREDQEAQS